MQYGPCENITVTNCTLMSTSAAIKFGTESEAPFRNITVQNCCISGTNRGISLQLRDCGSIEHVLFSNLTIETRIFSPDYYWGKAEPIAITATRRTADTVAGRIRDVRFQNISCTGENGILIYGDSSRNISDLTFDGVRVHIRKTTDWPRNLHDLRPGFEGTQIQDFQCGLYVRNASDIQFHDFCLESEEQPDEPFVPVSIEESDRIVVERRKEV
jgi:hypothetical protein